MLQLLGLSLGTARLLGLGVGAIALWFVYGWGSQIIENYTEMPKKIERLERDKALIESRVESYKTLLARRDAAINASRCREQIKKWVKDPDSIPNTSDPFKINGGN